MIREPGMMTLFGLQIGSWLLEPEQLEHMMKTALLIDGLPWFTYIEDSL
jgi:hypothetical protein